MELLQTFCCHLENEAGDTAETEKQPVSLVTFSAVELTQPELLIMWDYECLVV